MVLVKEGLTSSKRFEIPSKVIREPAFIDFDDALRVNIYRPSYNSNLISEQETEQVSVQVNEQDDF